jgi:hypothetical protein
MLKISAKLSLSILLFIKNISAQPLKDNDLLAVVNFETPPQFFERLLAIGFLVLLGGVFAGKKFYFHFY